MIPPPPITYFMDPLEAAANVVEVRLDLPSFGLQAALSLIVILVLCTSVC